MDHDCEVPSNFADNYFSVFLLNNVSVFPLLVSDNSAFLHSINKY